MTRSLRGPQRYARSNIPGGLLKFENFAAGMQVAIDGDKKYLVEFVIGSNGRKSHQATLAWKRGGKVIRSRLFDTVAEAKQWLEEQAGFVRKGYTLGKIAP